MITNAFRKTRSGVHQQKNTLQSLLRGKGKWRRMPGMILRAVEVNRSYYRTERVGGDLRETLEVNLAWLSLRSHWTHGKGKALACIHIESFSKPTASASHYTCRRNRPTASDQTRLRHELFTSEGRNATQVKRRPALARAELPGRNHPGSQAGFWGSSQAPSRQTLSGSYTTSHLLWGTKIPETMSELLRAAQFTSSPSEPWWCRAKSSSKGFKGTGPPHKPKAVWFIKWTWERTQKGHVETRDFWGTRLCVNNGTSATLICWVQRSIYDLKDCR